MLFAKVILIIAILIAIGIGLAYRIRAWRRRRAIVVARKKAAKAQWEAELAGDLRER